MTNSPQPITYPVNIEYISGSGPLSAILGQRVLLTSEETAIDNPLTVIFDPPVTITIESNPFFQLIDPKNSVFIQVEYPLGNITRQLAPPQYTQPLDLPANEPVTKLSIGAGAFNNQYQVDILLNNFAVNPVNLPTYDPNDALSIQRQQEVNSERLIDAVNNLATTVQRQSEIASENVGTKLDNVALNLQRQGEILSESQISATADLATQLTTAFGTNITEFANNLAQTLTGVTGLPLAIIEPLINAIKLLFESEAKNVAEDVNKSFTLNKLPLAEAIRQGNETLNNALQKRGDVINKLLSGQYKSLDDFYKDFNTSGANVGILQTLQNTFTIAYLLFTYLKARTQTSEIVLSQLMLSQDTPNLNDINTNVLAYLRGFKTYVQLAVDLAKYGLDESKVNELLTTRSLLTSLNDIKTAFQRGLIDETQHDTLLSKYGIAPGNIQLIKDVYPLLPSPTDITRMADKHIFAPDIPQIFGQNSEVDDGYLKSMELWGIDEQWTRKLWASHWSLPGLQETFDLWHRGLISDSELDTFFKLTDILPFFREKLKLLSHNLIGRVDIRRFYHVGVFTQQDVYNAFIKLGFSETDAQKQTQFTIENDRQSDLPKHVKIRALTEGMVVKAFKEGIISEQDAINRLGTVGYLPADASLILALETQTANIGKTGDKTELYHNKVVSLILKSYADGVISRTDAKNNLTQIGIPSGQADIELYYSEIERIVHLKSLVINHVRSAYTKGQIDKAGATNLMLTHGFGMSEIELLFEELDISKSLRSKELSLVQVEKLLKAGIITVSQFAQELANMGYNDTHIGWLLQEIVGV